MVSCPHQSTTPLYAQLLMTLRLESAKKNGNCSLSDGMRKLGQAAKLRAFDIGDATWQDVDTPEALAYAETVFDQYFWQAAEAERFAHV